MDDIEHYMQAVSRLRAENARLESELREASAEVPETFYADLPLRDRVKQLVRIWQNAVRANQDLEKEKLLWDEWDAQDRQKTREINILTKEVKDALAAKAEAEGERDDWKRIADSWKTELDAQKASAQLFRETDAVIIKAANTEQQRMREALERCVRECPASLATDAASAALAAEPSDAKSQALTELVKAATEYDDGSYESGTELFAAARQYRKAVEQPRDRALQATEVFASAVSKAVEEHIHAGRMGYRDGKLVILTPETQKEEKEKK